MISVLKGMKDRYSDDVKKYDAIVDASKKVFGKYGFERIITPILEETELFRRGVGAVSYTHLDVYKRQICNNSCVSIRRG